MNRVDSPQRQAAQETPADETEPQGTATEQPHQPQAAEASVNKEQRVALLSSITTSPVIGSGMEAFLPRDMMQAIEFSKMMAAGNFVPPHLRDKPGDCLAVVLQSVRWRADPFAVAGKTYFINDRMAFEAQLVNAVLNTSKVLDGRLQITWQGKVQTPGFQCTVRGRIRGDEEVHELIQETDTISKKNSPLWKMSERIQLGYYTTRGWGRLFTPEVMLGIYTPDEIEDGMGDDAPVVGQQIIEPRTYSIPPRPTTASVRAEKEAEADAMERMRKEDVARQTAFRQQTAPEATDVQTATSAAAQHGADPTTGELPAKEDDRPDADQGEVLPPVDWDKEAKRLSKALLAVGSDMVAFGQFRDGNAVILERMAKEAPGYFAKISTDIKAKGLFLSGQKA